ncbi:MAG: response regulator [Candidatus Pacebacteria bacterium]|nr:response regulator [Candidatus Paceibacterota bacterium]
MEAGQKRSVLLLDDEKFLLDLYRIVFERNGFEVTSFTSADDALQLLRADYHPDVILFDITMPQGKSGYEFIETIVREGLAKGSMKVALTNEAQEGEIQRIRELGADAHMVKALYVPSQLASVVGDMLAKWKSNAPA